MPNLRLATTATAAVLLSTTSLHALDQARQAQVNKFYADYADYIEPGSTVKIRDAMFGTTTVIEHEANGVEIERVYEGDTLTPVRDELEDDRAGIEREVSYVDGKPKEIEIAVGEAEYEGYLDDFDGNFDCIDLASLERDDDDDYDGEDDDEDKEYAGRYDDGDDDDDDGDDD